MALAGVTGMCLAGRGGFLLCFYFFFSLCTLCNCCEIPPGPNALGHGEWRGHSRLHKLSRSRQGNGWRPLCQEGSCQISLPRALLQPPGTEEPPRD